MLKCVVSLLLLLIGPAPWCVSIAASQAPRVGPRAAFLLGLLVVWCTIETAIALGMGALGVFHVDALVAAEAAVLVGGIVFAARPWGLPLPVSGGQRSPWIERTIIAAVSIAGTGL